MINVNRKKTKFMKERLMLVILFLFSSFICFTQVSVKQVDPLRKVLKEDKALEPYNNIHPAAYGEVLTIQFVLGSTRNQEGVRLSFSSSTIGKTILDKIKVFRIGYIKASPVTLSPA